LGSLISRLGRVIKQRKKKKKEEEEEGQGGSSSDFRGRG